MCSTPAPVSTVLVASSIWPGTGDVNTSPAHAASSMPSPTKPPCSGSCPEPPPAMRPTLRDLAASIPSSASATTFSGALMSFFIEISSGGCVVGLAQTVGSGGGLGLHLRLHPGLWVGRRAGDGAEDQSREDSGK